MHVVRGRGSRPVTRLDMPTVCVCVFSPCASRYLCGFPFRLAALRAGSRIARNGGRHLLEPSRLLPDGVQRVQGALEFVLLRGIRLGNPDPAHVCGRCCLGRPCSRRVILPCAASALRGGQASGRRQPKARGLKNANDNRGTTPALSVATMSASRCGAQNTHTSAHASPERMRLPPPSVHSHTLPSRAVPSRRWACHVCAPSPRALPRPAAVLSTGRRAG